MDRIVPLATVERMVWPYHAPGTTRSSVYRASPVTFEAPSLRGTERPTEEGVNLGVAEAAIGVIGAISWGLTTPEARHLPNRSRSTMPAILKDTPPVSDGARILAPVTPAFAEILTPGAVRFIADLARRFEPRRRELLARRAVRQREFDAGAFPDFLASTADVRAADWRVAPIPSDLLDRRVEITGPVDRKMVINALNSGAQVYMADFEDSHSPTWRATLEGQINLRDAVRGTIEFKSPEGKQYALQPRTATLMVRPRGWHLIERHVTVDGQPISGSLFDFGLFFFHNARALMARTLIPAAGTCGPSPSPRGNSSRDWASRWV